MSIDNPTPLEVLSFYEHHCVNAPPGERFAVSIPAMKMIVAEYRRLEAAHTAICKELVDLKERREVGRPAGRPRKEVADEKANA